MARPCESTATCQCSKQSSHSHARTICAVAGDFFCTWKLKSLPSPILCHSLAQCGTAHRDTPMSATAGASITKNQYASGSRTKWAGYGPVYPTIHGRVARQNRCRSISAGYGRIITWMITKQQRSASQHSVTEITAYRSFSRRRYGDRGTFNRRTQLFLEVTAKKTAGSCSTFLLPHFGHFTLPFSCSVRVSATSKLL